MTVLSTHMPGAAAGHDALRAVADALLGTPAGAVLAGYDVEELVERFPAVLLEAVAANASCRDRLSESPVFTELAGRNQAWRMLVAANEAERQSALITLLGLDSDAPSRGAGAQENARLQEQVSALRRRVDELGRAGRQEAAARAAAEVQRLRTSIERSDREVAQLRETHRVLSDERNEAIAELRSLRRSIERLDSLQGRARLLLEAVERELTSMPPPSPAAVPVDLEDYEVQRRVLEAAASSLQALLNLQRSSRTDPPVVSGLRSLDITVTSLGGGEEIGGSCLLLEVADRRLLIDCGARPGASRMDELGPPGLAAMLGEPIDAIFVTHAHNDHVGYLPALLRAQQKAPPVFTTPQTAALLPPMWADAVRLLSDRHQLARRLSATGGEVTEPPFGPTDVDVALAAVRTVLFGEARTMGDLEFTLFPAGHVMGAAGIVLRVGNRLLVISGDICDQPQASVGAADLNAVPTDADLLVLESTYCRDDHTGRAREVERFVQDVEDVVRGGGTVLVPVFGLGRAQEVAMILRDKLPHVPVRVDGIARAISRIYEDQWRLDGQPTRILVDNVRDVSGDRREATAAFKRGVVVTTSGMLTGGPAVEWARSILPEPRSALFLCGYQDEDSPGRRLLELADGRPGRRAPLELPSAGRMITVNVNARVARYHLSAHADRRGLVSIVDRLRPGVTMLVHGNRRDQTAFRASLNASGRRTIVAGRWTADGPAQGSGLRPSVP